MKVFRSTAGLLIIFAVIFGFAASGRADYKFDDIAGPSGRSYQWMILNKAGDTIGESHRVAIDISGDVLTTGDAVLNVLSGQSENAITDRELDTLFIAAVEGLAGFNMNYRAQTLNQQYEVAAPDLRVSSPWDEQTTVNELYSATKESLGQPSGRYDALWRSYKFQIARANTSQYDSVAQYFYFHQNPTYTPSQGIPHPMVIANVGNGPADDPQRSLKLRTILRDASSPNANIVAYDQFTWTMTGPKTAGSRQWVFVPVSDLNVDNSTINYYLTTEVINRCAYRYAAYDGTSNNPKYPDSWKFNLLRLHGSPYIRPSFQLAPDSHIAPGLVTVYKRAYNVNETDKIPLRLYPIDDSAGIGVYALTLNHNILFGKKLGETYKLPAQVGSFNQIEVTAFQPRTKTGTIFYDNVARITGSARTVASPSTNALYESSIKRNEMTDPVIQYFTVEQQIPANLRSASTEGILPLHITFNIPLTKIGADMWNSMLRELRRHEEDANITDAFADHFALYLQADTNGKPNVWNLTQELANKGVYSQQVKVFLDQERGRATVDTDRGVMTVSFIAMLMDGNRDGSRPELSIVPDGNDTSYIVIRDGNFDNKWKMTFFIAPADYFDNTSGGQGDYNPDNPNSDSPDSSNPSGNSNQGGWANGNNQNNTGGSGGGGGCNSGLAGLAVMAVIFAFMRKRGGKI